MNCLKTKVLVTATVLFLSGSIISKMFAQGTGEKPSSDEQKHVYSHAKSFGKRKSSCLAGGAFGCIDKMLPNLTDEQKKKIKEIDISLAKEILPLRNQLNEKKAHLKTLMTAEKADITAINETIDEIAQLRSTIMKKNAAKQQSIRALLTDEQKIVFDFNFHYFSLCYGIDGGSFGKGAYCRKERFHRKFGPPPDTSQPHDKWKH